MSQNLEAALFVGGVGFVAEFTSHLYKDIKKGKFSGYKELLSASMLEGLLCTVTMYLGVESIRQEGFGDLELIAGLAAISALFAHKIL